MSDKKFISVEITGFAVCKELNRLGLKPIYHPKYYDELNRWKIAESERKEFTIKSAVIDGEEIICDEGNPRDPDVFLEAFPIGSIQKVVKLNDKIVQILEA